MVGGDLSRFERGKLEVIPEEKHRVADRGDGGEPAFAFFINAPFFSREARWGLREREREIL